MLETETPHGIETEAAQPKFDFSLSRPAELELRIRDGDACVNMYGCVRRSWTGRPAMIKRKTTTDIPGCFGGFSS